MADPISFPSQTRNTQLPLLLSGQAQKEFFLNQSLVTIDALLPGAIEDVLDSPPESPVEGLCFLIGTAASGEWSGRNDQIAIQIGNGWHYVEPTDGMELYDRASSQKLIFNTQWYRPLAPQAPTDGAIIDSEARAALSDLIASLQSAGVVGPSI